MLGVSDSNRWYSCCVLSLGLILLLDHDVVYWVTWIHWILLSHPIPLPGRKWTNLILLTCIFNILRSTLYCSCFEIGRCVFAWNFSLRCDTKFILLILINTLHIWIEYKGFVKRCTFRMMYIPWNLPPIWHLLLRSFTTHLIQFIN